MKKTPAKSKRKTTKRVSAKRSLVRTSRANDPVLLNSSSNGFFGKDQQMVVLLSAGIIVLIVAGMYLAGWL